MKHISFLLLLLVLLLPACRDHEEKVPDEISEILGLKIDRPLEVVFASPKGDTSGPKDYESVSVVFNQPMKALSAESASIATPFEIQPSVKGRFRWKGTATVSFEPKEPLAFGTEYEVVVPAGLTSPSGNSLESEYRFKFSTPGPKVLKSIPKSGARERKKSEPLFLIFDQPVEPGAVGALLSYSSPSGSPQPKARTITEEELKKLNQERAEDQAYPSERVVAVDPGDIESDTTYTLKLDKGLKGMGGPLPSKREHLLTFTTLGPFEWSAPAKEKKVYPPSRGVPFYFNNKVNAKALKENLEISPEVPVEVSDYDETDNWNSHTLYLPLEPNTNYTFTVKGSLEDVHGQSLGKDVSFSRKTGDRSPRANVPEGLAVLEAKNSLTIPVGLRNIDHLTYRMVKLDRDQVVSLLTRDDSNWLWGTSTVTPPKPFDVVKSLKPQGAKNEMYTYKLDLREALKTSPYGFVYYQVELKGADRTFHRRGLVQVTNIGATGKFSPENSLFMATTLDTAKPLDGIEATVLDQRGRPVWRGKTGVEGTVKAPGWSELLTQQTPGSYAPSMYLFLKQGQDEAFVQNGGFGQVSSWQFDIPFRWSSSSHYLTSKVYSERGLYRPGEEVHLKGSLRDREGGEWVLPQVSQLRFSVKDSRDQKVDEGRVDLSEFGTFHHTQVLGEKAPTGAYRVDYSLDPDLAKKWDVAEEVAGVTFRVEEFEAAQFKVDLESDTKALVMGDNLSFTIKADWLFGAPMNDTEVQWGARIEPAVYSNEEYPGFRFGPFFSQEDDRDETKTLKTKKTRTDGNGTVKGEVALEGIPYRGDADLVVEATATSTNRRSITGFLTVPVARGRYRIGLKPSSTFLPSGSPVAVQTVTLTPEGQPSGKKELKIELVRREWNSVRKSDVDGRFRWVTEVEDKVVQTVEHTTGNKTEEVKVTPKEAGYYIVRATGTDENGNSIVTESSFYVHGSGYVPWGRGEGDTIELVPDKTRYAPGETAKILIKNPFPEATALITYERDTIVHSYTEKLEGSAPVIEVPLTKEHLPNLYISVMLFRGRVEPATEDDTEDTGKPAFKIGYVELPVSPESKRLKVEVGTDAERYGPGDEVVAKLKVTDSSGKPVRAELSVTAADVGVLNLINFQTPDLFDTYYSGLPLAVKTAEGRLDVIGQRSYGTKGEDEGGGGGYNPKFRKDFKSTAVWDPQVVTDRNGEAEVRFTLPGNLTTFRIMATAITADTQCGSADEEIISTKPLVLKPSTPAFARIGDEFQAGVLAVNHTEKGSTLKVTMQSEGVKAKSTEPREIFLQAGEEREVLFTFVPQKEGAATLRFSGQMGDESDGIQYDVPLQLATQKVNLAHTGHLDEGSVEQEVVVPLTAVPETTKLKVHLSSTILLGLENSVEALLDYPYGCLEQRLSRATPLLLADQLVERMELQGWNEAKVRATVQKTLDQIPTYAASDGGLKVWPDSTLVHPFLTARAVRTAHIAKEQGYKVKGPWLDKARSYLKRYLDGEVGTGLQFDEQEKLVSQAAALEALTRYGFSGNAYLSKLMEQRDKVPVAGRAFMLQAAYRLDNKKAAATLTKELTNSIKLENATAYFEVDENRLSWLFSSDIRDTGLATEALLVTEQKLPMADKLVTWLLEGRNDRGEWGTTANNASALAALVAYSNRFEESSPELETTVELDGKEMQRAELDKNNLQASLEEGLKPGGKSTVELSKSGEGRLYYTVGASYEDTEPSPPVDEGFTLIRTIVDLDGKPVSRLEGGKLYKVKLSVLAPNLRRYVVLRDPIPAGASVVKTDFATESKQLSELLERGEQPSWQTFQRFEDYNDRVLLFADALAPGEHTYEYLIRAQTPGTYLHPAAQVEEMYHPELFGRTAQHTVEVK